jgi:preprotein translocase subunit SecD
VAPPAGTLRVGRYFLALLIIFVVLFGVVFWPGQPHAPKLGLDLRGGAQIIYKAQTLDGKQPSSSSMNEAKNIIDQRVNGLGVEQSQVIIQGSDEIVVTIPGKRADQLDNVGKTALLNFRPLIAGPFAITTATPTATPTASGTATGTATGSTTPGASTSATAPVTTPANTASAAATTGASGQNAGARPLALDTATPTPTASATPTVTPSASTTPTGSAAATPSASSTAAVTSPASLTCPATPTTPTAADTAAIAGVDSTAIGFADLCLEQKLAIAKYNCGDAVSQDTKAPIVTCDTAHSVKYVLAGVLVPGTEVSSAAAQAPNAASGQFQWAVTISLKSSGQKTWSEYTAAHHNSDSTGQTQDTVAANYVDFTLDDEVISNTNIQSTINGDTQVTGNFTQTQASQLANSLKYGALPLKFQQLTSQTVSATLGTAQLKAGLLAGGIGLILVVIYSLLYYRALGLVTIASLVVSGGLTYAALVILGHQIGFTLTLAGIAGFIVAVGITADSFVVFFERIKDEVHEGRSMRVAVPRAWIRARRTILSADTVSFLAAAVLYEFAAGDVRGFAFTLGMSTILDLVVVFLFTHPLVSILSRSRAFGSARFTGLNAVREGGIALPAPSPRRTAPTHKGGGKPAPAIDTASTTGLALLDPEDGELDDDVVEDEPTFSLTKLDSPQPAADESAVVPPSTPPAAGTAAERAAARRAKMRAEAGPRGKKGSS